MAVAGRRAGSRRWPSGRRRRSRPRPQASAARSPAGARARPRSRRGDGRCASASSGVTPHAKCSNVSVCRSQGREHGRRQPLDVAAGVAGDRPDVVRGGDPRATWPRRPYGTRAASARRRGATARRRSAGRPALAASRTRPRANRRGSSCPGRSPPTPPGPRSAPARPTCRRQVRAQLVGDEVHGAMGRRSRSVAAAGVAGPSGRQPSRAARAATRSPRRSPPVPERPPSAAGTARTRQDGGLAGEPRPGGDHERERGPRRAATGGRELRVERPGPDQLDDRQRVAAAGRAPPPGRSGRTTEWTPEDGGWTPAGAYARPAGSVKPTPVAYFGRTRAPPASLTGGRCPCRRARVFERNDGRPVIHRRPRPCHARAREGLREASGAVGAGPLGSHRRRLAPASSARTVPARPRRCAS